MYPGLVAAALGDRSNPGVLLNFVDTRVTPTLFTEGGEQARGEGGTCTGQRAKQRVVRQCGLDRRSVARSARRRAAARAIVRPGPGPVSDCFDDCHVFGESASRLDRLDARFDDVRVAHVVLMEERAQTSLARALGLLERGP